MKGQRCSGGGWIGTNRRLCGVSHRRRDRGTGSGPGRRAARSPRPALRPDGPVDQGRQCRRDLSLEPDAGRLEPVLHGRGQQRQAARAGGHQRPAGRRSSWISAPALRRTRTASLSQLTAVGAAFSSLANSGRQPALDQRRHRRPARPRCPSPAPSYRRSIGALTSVGDTLVFETTDFTSSGVDYAALGGQPGQHVRDASRGLRDTSPVGVIGGSVARLYLSVGGNLWTTGGTANGHVQE